jgi:lipoic acid synthetase
MAREAGLVTKSNLILGMGEQATEIEAAIADLHDAGCDILTITQYLRPSPKHHPIDRWVKPEEFLHWSSVATDRGFKGVMAGPLVRSSYRAGRLWAQAMQRWGRPVPDHLAHLADAAQAPARQEAAAVVAAAAAVAERSGAPLS